MSAKRKTRQLASLDQFGHIENTKQIAAAAVVRDASDEELSDWLIGCRQVTETNCWFAVYDAAKWLPDLIRREQYRRERVMADVDV